MFAFCDLHMVPLSCFLHLWSHHAVSQASLFYSSFSTAALVTFWTGYYVYGNRLSRNPEYLSSSWPAVCWMPVVLWPPYSLPRANQKSLHMVLFSGVGTVETERKICSRLRTLLLEPRKIHMHNTIIFEISQWGTSFERC